MGTKTFGGRITLFSRERREDPWLPIDFKGEKRQSTAKAEGIITLIQTIIVGTNKFPRDTTKILQ